MMNQFHRFVQRLRSGNVGWTKKWHIKYFALEWPVCIYGYMIVWGLRCGFPQSLVEHPHAAPSLGGVGLRALGDTVCTLHRRLVNSKWNCGRSLKTVHPQHSRVYRFATGHSSPLECLYGQFSLCLHHSVPADSTRTRGIDRWKVMQRDFSFLFGQFRSFEEFDFALAIQMPTNYIFRTVCRCWILIQRTEIIDLQCWKMVPQHQQNNWTVPRNWAEPVYLPLHCSIFKLSYGH